MVALLFAFLPPVTVEPVTVEAGDLPIVISAPHGGRDRLAGVPDRVGTPATAGKPKASGFQTAFDSGTNELAHAVADAIAARLGKRPYLVVSNTTRKQLDPNRPESIGVESEGARPAYRTYHDALAKDRAEILQKYGAGLLIDLHGQGSTADAIYRGTGDGTSVAGLPREALVGKDGLLSNLEAHGVRFIPTCAEEGKPEAKGLSGGWIVRHYGASQDAEDGARAASVDRFWAVQMEMGIDFRRSAARAETAAKLADAVAAFARAQLGVKPK